METFQPLYKICIVIVLNLKQQYTFSVKLFGVKQKYQHNGLYTFYFLLFDFYIFEMHQ